MIHQPVVAIVDDDAGVRRALCRLVESVGLSTQSFPSADAFLDQYDPGQPGCLVLDVWMPGVSGLELQERLIALHSLLPTIFITGHGDIPTAVRAIQAGAVDFLQKPFDDRTLLAAVRRALERDRIRRHEMIRSHTAHERLQRLTPREREVLGLVVSGLMNKQVAARLGASEKTIKVHRARVMRKMQAGSLAELVILAQAAGVSAPGFASRAT